MNRLFNYDSWNGVLKLTIIDIIFKVFYFLDPCGASVTLLLNKIKSNATGFNYQTTNRLDTVLNKHFYLLLWNLTDERFGRIKQGKLLKVVFHGLMERWCWKHCLHSWIWTYFMKDIIFHSFGYESMSSPTPSCVENWKILKCVKLEMKARLCCFRLLFIGQISYDGIYCSNLEWIVFDFTTHRSLKIDHGSMSVVSDFL